MKWKLRKSSLGLILVLSVTIISCDDGLSNETKDGNRAISKSVNPCDSIYHSFFEEGNVMNEFEVISFYDLKSMDQLRYYSDSAHGHFILDFRSDTSSKPDLMKARFIYFDRDFRLEHPKFGLSFQENYDFKFSEDKAHVSLLASLEDEKTFDTSELMDTVRSRLNMHYLGDSLVFSNLTRVEFYYLEPPSVDDFKKMALDLKEIIGELLRKLCDEFEPNDPSLQFRIQKLAYLGVQVSYDWAETTDYLIEVTPPGPRNDGNVTGSVDSVDIDKP